jgi:hypothetical protein
MKRYLLSATLVLIVAYSLILTGCGAGDLHQLNTTLDKAAAVMNGAAKSNHSFYESGIYGAVGSDGAIKMRQRVATVIHDANEKLILAIGVAKTLTPATFEGGKLQILAALSDAVSGLHVGNEKADLVLQAIAAVINQAVIIVSTFKASDLKRAMPYLQNLRMPEVAV